MLMTYLCANCEGAAKEIARLRRVEAAYTQTIHSQLLTIVELRRELSEYDNKDEDTVRDLCEDRVELTMERSKENALLKSRNEALEAAGNNLRYEARRHNAVCGNDSDCRVNKAIAAWDALTSPAEPPKGNGSPIIVSEFSDPYCEQCDTPISTGCAHYPFKTAEQGVATAPVCEVCVALHKIHSIPRAALKMGTDRDWLLKKADQEDGTIISVGGLITDLSAHPMPTDEAIRTAGELCAHFLGLAAYYHANEHHSGHRKTCNNRVCIHHSEKARQVQVAIGRIR